MRTGIRQTARGLGVWAVLWAIGMSGAAWAAAARFDVPAVTADKVELRLTGDDGAEYRVESSTNLLGWTVAGSGKIANGALRLVDTVPAGTRARYYRAVRAGGATPYPTVAFQTNALLTASTVLEPGRPGVIRLRTTGTDEVAISFPTNAVFAPTLVTMTWVSNLTGVPAERGLVSGVLLQPAGLVLSAPAILDLPLSSGVPATRVSSYAFEASGADLHLVPDVVTTNRVRVYVGQLMGYGTGVFTLGELQSLAATVPPVGARKSRPGLHASMEECYPEDEEAARELREDLEDAIRPYQQRAAKVLGEERQKQLLGVSDDGAEGMSVLAGLMADADTFVAQEITPRIEAAKTRCATTRELIPWLLGIERQKQLLGVSSDDATSGTPAWQSLICEGMKRCQDQALQCCRTQGGDTRLISFLLGIERQRQLLGIEGASCGEPLDTQGLLDDCAPKWFGTIVYTLRGSYETNRSNDQTLWTDRRTMEYRVEAVVEAVEENIFEPVLFVPGHTNLVFTLSANVQGAVTRDYVYDDLWDPCGSSTATAGTKALATVRPHDGGEALLDRIMESGQGSTNGLQLEVRATLMAPGSGALGITPRLQFQIPSFKVPRKGHRDYLLEIVESTGCDRDDRSGPISGEHTFPPAGFARESGGFQYTSDSIRFLRITPRLEEQMVLIEEVRLDLRRVR